MYRAPNQKITVHACIRNFEFGAYYVALSFLFFIRIETQNISKTLSRQRHFVLPVLHPPQFHAQRERFITFETCYHCLF